jgi:hypothetical protein
MAKSPSPNNTKARRVAASLHLPASDARRLARSLASRAEWLERRREGDLLIRTAAHREAAYCRRIAAKLLAALVEVSR